MCGVFYFTLLLSISLLFLLHAERLTLFVEEDFTLSMWKILLLLPLSYVVILPLIMCGNFGVSGSCVSFWSFKSFSSQEDLQRTRLFEEREREGENDAF